MKQKKYKKTPSVLARKQWFELYFSKNVPVDAIAADYKVPISTVYYWLRKMDPKRKQRSDKGKAQKSAVLELPDITAMTLDGQTLEQSIELVINGLIQAITANKKIKLNSATTAINQLTLNLRRLRSIQFEAMAKSIDAKIVEGIIKHYEPTATSMRVIEVFKEARARVRSEKANG